jgi:hypothetical protein
VTAAPLLLTKRRIAPMFDATCRTNSVIPRLGGRLWRCSGHGLVLSAVITAPLLAAPTLNGFDLGDAEVPLQAIEKGGPPRDGIPSIDAPRFVPAAEAELRPDDRVLGVALNGVAKAYPVRILNWHEIVNDRFGDDPVVVTYCPLCASGIAFHGRVGGKSLEFGVSGLLYNSDVLLYDRQTETLWSQISQRAISGPLRDAELVSILTSHTSWADWRARHPTSLVLSEQTGFQRDYSYDPYADYAAIQRVLFPTTNTDTRLPPKAVVIGIKIGDQTKAYPFKALEEAVGPVRDRVGDTPIRVRYDPEHRSARIEDETGEPLPTLTAYWFAWFAFHPETELFVPPP